MHSILRRSAVYRGKSFDESKHPRGEGGKFGEGGGSAGKPENKLPRATKSKGPKPDDPVHGYLAAFNDPTDKATAEDARTANKELKEEGSKYRIIPDEENRGKWKIAHVKWLNDEISEDWTVGVNALTGNVELADRNYLKEMQAISGDRISRGYLAAFNDPNEAVTEEDAATANEEMAADGSKFQIAYDKDYGLWVAKPREEKSSTRWVKSKDASGRENSASVSGKPASNLPK